MKKAILISLALLLLMMSFSGCSQPESDLPKQPDDSTAHSTQPSSEPSAEPEKSDILIIRRLTTGSKDKEGTAIHPSASHLEKWTVYYLSGSDIVGHQDYYLYGSEAIAAECVSYYSYWNGTNTGKIIATDKIASDDDDTREELLASIAGSKTAEVVDSQDIQILYDNADAYVNQHLSPVTVKHDPYAAIEQEWGIVEFYEVVYFDDYGVYSSHDRYTVFTDAAAAQAYQSKYTEMTAEGNVVYLLSQTSHSPYSDYGYTKFGGYGVYDYCERWYKTTQKADYEVIEAIVTPLD